MHADKNHWQLCIYLRTSALIRGWFCPYFKCLSSQPITVLYQNSELAGFSTQ